MTLPPFSALPALPARLAEKLQPPPEARLPVVSTELAHKRFLSLWHRTTRYPDGRVVAWDVAGHGAPDAGQTFCVVFPYDRRTGTVRLVYEYAQGPNAMCFNLPCGAFDAHKHASMQDAAVCELSEEASLRGGSWVGLLPPEHAGLAELKWSKNRYHPFLVIDAEPDAAGGALDAEEFLSHLDVSLPELRQIMLSGLMLPPAVQVCFMGLEKLRELGVLDAPPA